MRKQSETSILISPDCSGNEADAFLASVRDVLEPEVEKVRRVLSAKGVELGRLVIGANSRASIEAGLTAYRDGQPCDAIEVEVWNRGGAAISLERVVEYFRTYLPSLG